MEKELVSVIIPAYNAERFIERCLKSILHQTYENLEVIVVDDGSVDQTGEICDKYAAEDARLTVLHIANGGVSNARNTGIHVARGAYVMFLDSDDYVAENFVESGYQAITEKQADLGILAAHFCYPKEMVNQAVEEKCIGTFSKEKFGEVFVWLYLNSYIHVIWNKIYRRELIHESFCTDMSWGEDMYFNLQYLEHAKSIGITGSCCYFYMCDEEKDSLTKRTGMDKFRCEEKIFRKTLETCKTLQIKDVSPIERLHAEHMIALLFGLAYSSVPSAEKKRIMAEVCEMETIQSVMSHIKTKYFYTEWIRLLLKHKKKRAVYDLFIVARVVRRCIDRICKR